MCKKKYFSNINLMQNWQNCICKIASQQTSQTPGHKPDQKPDQKPSQQTSPKPGPTLGILPTR